MDVKQEYKRFIIIMNSAYQSNYNFMHKK